MKRLGGIYLLETLSFPLIYGRPKQQAIARRVEIVAPPQPENPCGSCHRRRARPL